MTAEVANFQYDACNLLANTSSASNNKTPQQHISLIRLKSGRKIWWLDNGIPSHRAEVMLRRRMRYLREELQQQLQQVVETGVYSNIISADCSSSHVLDNSSASVDDIDDEVIPGADVAAELDCCEKGGEGKGQRNNSITDISDIDHENQAPSSCEWNGAAINGKITSQRTTSTGSSGSEIHNNGVNEVSLESIDEQSISEHQVLQYCHQNDIPIITLSSTNSKKTTCIDFGDDSMNRVGTVSTRQFLLHHVSTTKQQQEPHPSLLSISLASEGGCCKNDTSIHHIKIERISSKGGFICMLDDSTTSSPTTPALNYNNSNNNNNNNDDSFNNPIHLNLMNGECRMVNVIWNPTLEGTVRESLEFQEEVKKTCHDEEMTTLLTRHEIVLVGSAAARNDESCIAIDLDSSKEKGGKNDEWNRVLSSIEYSEIRYEEDSHSDLVVEGVRLTITEESMEFADSEEEEGSQAQLAEVENTFINSKEVREIALMMEYADISPKKASMAAKSLSEVAPNKSSGADKTDVKRKSTDGIVANKEMMMMKNERILADENIFLPKTSQVVVNNLNMNHKVRHLLDNFDDETTSTDDRRSESSTPTFGSLSSEEDFIPVDITQQQYNQPIRVDVTDKKMTVDFAHVDEGRDNEQQNTEMFNVVASKHYDKVNVELNALMDDVSEELQSESDDMDSYISSENNDQSRDEKFGFFDNFYDSTFDEGNEEVNILPETSIDNSSDWDSSGTDTSLESDKLRRKYKQMSSDLDGLMDEISDLEEFAQMQQNYLLSPSTHDFQTQLENLSEQIDNLLPFENARTSARKSIISASNESQKLSLALRVNETTELKTKKNTGSSPKDSAQKCYFYKPPKEPTPLEETNTLSTQCSDQNKEERVTYKSPFGAILDAEASFQTIDSMLGSTSSSDETISSSETECDESDSLADLDVETSASLASSHSSSSVPSRNSKTSSEIKSFHETRAKRIALMRSKLSSLNVNSCETQTNHQSHTPSLPTDLQSSSTTKISKSNPSFSAQKLQPKTPVLKQLDVVSLTVSASIAQKSARRNYYFSQTSTNTPSDSVMTSTAYTTPRTPGSQRKKQVLKTPTSNLALAKLKTPSSTTAYEKHISRIRSAKKGLLGGVRS